MKLPNDTRNVTSTFTGVETSKFSIDVSGKMFDILLDGLYTNKVLAMMRELWSNAADSHVAAGMDSIPFDCSLPSHLDPTFRVRDYGVSMTHEQIMGLYSIVGRSTKDDDNSVVGAFGLGSKSPFAYSDSFTVIARLNGEKRTYFASRDSEGMPNIALVSTVESDEAQGIEVSVACNLADASQFQREAVNLAVGFDPLPQVDGVEIAPTTPVYVANDGSCAVFGQGTLGFSSCVGVRQGWVIYPVDSFDIRQIAMKVLSDGYKMVIDVPIGAVSVVASREALSMDDDTKQVVTDAVTAACESLKAEVVAGGEKCTTHLEALHYWFGGGVNKALKVVPKYRGETLNRTFQIKPTKKVAPLIGKRGNQKGEPKIIDQFSYGDLANYRFITHYPQSVTAKVPRAMMRFKEEISQRGENAILLINPTGPQLARLARLLGLKQDQIEWVGNLPDPGPPMRNGSYGGYAGRGKGKLVGVYSVSPHGTATVVNEIDSAKPYLWAGIERITNALGQSYGKNYRELTGLGVVADDTPLYLFTGTAEKRYKPNGTNIVDLIAKTKGSADSYLDDMVLYQYNQQVRNTMPDGSVKLAKDCGISRYNAINSFFGWPLRDKATKVTATRMATLHERYPLLFNRYDAKAQADYVKLVDAANKV